MSVKSILAASALLGAQLVAGHAAIIDATGDAGGKGMAIGVDPNTPRDGTRRNPFQQDATRFRGASAETAGETLQGGANNVESGTEAIMGMTGDSLPQVTQGGELRMTVHQVNADGAGPYKCMINSDGTAQSWTDIQVTQNLPGNNRGRNRQGNASDQPLKAAIPQNQQCTGNVAGQDNVCLVRCQNPARAGPFGGVMPVQMVSNGANGGAGGNGAGGNGAGGNGAGGNGASTGKAASGGGAGAGARTGAGARNGAGAGAGAATDAADANTGRQGRQGRGGRRGRQGANAANNNPADDIEDERKVKRADAAADDAAAADAEEEAEEEEDAVLTKRAAFIKRIDEKTRAVEFTA